jgi:signal transduction histidine kinase
MDRPPGPSASADVTIDCGPNAVRLSISGNGCGGPPDDMRGSGLRGMRERAELLGGNLTVGDRTGGGLAVCANLPVPGTT